MTACPRDYCGGSRLLYGGLVQCVLCARGEVLARPPTAEEKAQQQNETNYFSGIYAVGFVPTVDDLTRAIW